MTALTGSKAFHRDAATITVLLAGVLLGTTSWAADGERRPGTNEVTQLALGVAVGTGTYAYHKLQVANGATDGMGIRSALSLADTIDIAYQDAAANHSYDRWHDNGPKRPQSAAATLRTTALFKGNSEFLLDLDQTRALSEHVRDKARFVIYWDQYRSCKSELLSLSRYVNNKDVRSRRAQLKIKISKLNGSLDVLTRLIHQRAADSAVKLANRRINVQTFRREMKYGSTGRLSHGIKSYGQAKTLSGIALSATAVFIANEATAGIAEADPTAVKEIDRDGNDSGGTRNGFRPNEWAQSIVRKTDVRK